jgi:hypothetical protein
MNLHVFGTPEEKKKFIAKMIAKSKADQGPIKTWQFALLAVLMGIVIVIQVMMMRGQTFV